MTEQAAQTAQTAPAVQTAAIAQNVPKEQYDILMNEFNKLKTDLKAKTSELDKFVKESSKKEREGLEKALGAYFDAEKMKAYKESSNEVLKVVLETVQSIRGETSPPPANEGTAEPQKPKGVVGYQVDGEWVI